MSFYAQDLLSESQQQPEVDYGDYFGLERKDDKAVIQGKEEKMEEKSGGGGNKESRKDSAVDLGEGVVEVPKRK